MKTMTLIAAIGLTSAMLALDAVAKPGRPEALTRGLGVNQAEPIKPTVAKRNAVKTGRPEAPTRGLGVGEAAPTTSIAKELPPEHKPGRPEYHTRGVYCSHRGRRG